MIEVVSWSFAVLMCADGMRNGCEDLRWAHGQVASMRLAELAAARHGFTVVVTCPEPHNRVRVYHSSFNVSRSLARLQFGCKYSALDSIPPAWNIPTSLPNYQKPDRSPRLLVLETLPAHSIQRSLDCQVSLVLVQCLTL